MSEMNQGDKYKEEESTMMEDKTNIKLPSKKILIMSGAIAIIVIVTIGVTYFTKGFGTTKKSKETIVTKSIAKFEYTQMEIQNLRTMGYTGDEIEVNQKKSTPSDQLMKAAKDSRDVSIKQQYKELSDAARTTGSDDYKTLLNLTWLINNPTTVSNANPNIFTTESMRYISQYIKVPQRGHQLQIRVVLDDGTYAFMTVHPTRWVSLKESGGIIIQYDKVKFGLDYFIQNLVEIPV